MNNITPVKSAIIGQAWKPRATQGSANTITLTPASIVLPQEMTFSADEQYLIGDLSFRTDRNLPMAVTVKAGERLFFYPNSKREGKQDPDLSVSVKLPAEVAEQVISGITAGREAWRNTPATV